MELQNIAFVKFIHDDSKFTIGLELNNKLFNATTMVYINLKKGKTNCSIYDVSILGNSIMLSAKAFVGESIPIYQVFKFAISHKKICKYS